MKKNRNALAIMAISLPFIFAVIGSCKTSSHSTLQSKETNRIEICQDSMNSGIIYGKNHAFGLTAPEGWILDNQSGVKYGIHAVFYRKGETWVNAETVMYANTASFEFNDVNTLEKLIEYDINNFKMNYRNVKSSKGKDINLKGGKIAKVRYFTGDKFGNFEAIAYIEEEKIGVMIVMSSKTKTGFDNSLTAFEKLVKSYFFISSKVIDLNQ